MNFVCLIYLVLSSKESLGLHNIYYVFCVVKSASGSFLSSVRLQIKVSLTFKNSLFLN